MDASRYECGRWCHGSLGRHLQVIENLPSSVISNERMQASIAVSRGFVAVSWQVHWCPKRIMGPGEVSRWKILFWKILFGYTLQATFQVDILWHFVISFSIFLWCTVICFVGTCSLRANNGKGKYYSKKDFLCTCGSFGGKVGRTDWRPTMDLANRVHLEKCPAPKAMAKN